MVFRSVISGDFRLLPVEFFFKEREDKTTTKLFLGAVPQHCRRKPKSRTLFFCNLPTSEKFGSAALARRFSAKSSLRRKNRNSGFPGPATAPRPHTTMHDGRRGNAATTAVVFGRALVHLFKGLSPPPEFLYVQARRF